jgi:hypothetical protein
MTTILANIPSLCPLRNVTIYMATVVGDNHRVRASQLGLTEGIENSYHVIIVHGSLLSFLANATLQSRLSVKSIESYEKCESDSDIRAKVTSNVQ